ncbi:MAG: RnfABCDGE type electron transport complex subunit B [Clostridia bacterium]|nr:RnfABCDGE type electron transport complex subunit B [Clostridia bacterium]
MGLLPIVNAIMVLGGIGAIFGAILTVASRVFAVQGRELEESIVGALPGANCGACGHPGCESFAAAIVRGNAKPVACIPGGRKVVAHIAALMGTEADDVAPPNMARVFCQGEWGTAEMRYAYKGLSSCLLASQMAGGPKKCPYACIGLGDCVAACKFGALMIENGIAKVDESKCTACAMCQNTCPRHSIQLFPAHKKATILCQNRQNARVARSACKKACIACGRCAKVCKFDAIHVVGGVTLIDAEKCTQCKACVEACPMGCVVVGG